MISLFFICVLTWTQVNSYMLNVTRTTISGIAAYRSALTLDWLADEDSRQRQLAGAFETEAAPPSRLLSTDCVAFPRPASGKVARLMLELLKNLEGDDGIIINELTQALIRAKLLVETFMLDAEPDLEALVKTPAVMMGEPYTNFPRILAMVWMAATDPMGTKRHGWCLISKVTHYLRISRPVQIAEQLRSLDPIIARARFIMEEFIQHVTPLNVFDDKSVAFGNPSARWNPKRTQREHTSLSSSSTEKTRTNLLDVLAGGQDILSDNDLRSPRPLGDTFHIENAVAKIVKSSSRRHRLSYIAVVVLLLTFMCM